SPVGEAENRTTGIWIPVRCPKSDECRHDVHTCAVGNRGGQGLDLRTLLDQPQAIPQPLERGAADEYAPREAVGQSCLAPGGPFAVQLPADGGGEPGGGADR